MQKTHLAIIILLLVNLVFTILLFTRKPQVAAPPSATTVSIDSNVYPKSYKYIKARDGADYEKAIPDVAAKSPREDFESEIAKTSLAYHKGVAYSLTSIQDYLGKGRMAAIIKRHEDKVRGKEDMSNYVWGLGYAWKYGDAANGKTGIGFYVLPVWMHKTTGAVIDYFDPVNEKFYDFSDINMYDEGHLFP
ncbi:MAG: hypothetical protein EOO15_20285 [Chitinophagaceae bacterium]|nr:MAG: hypothetical protein EOO15_20285 [Chitinophagaceae bacterium]